jgi:eukaryotic-like serine/threonine-protein kinase
VPEPGDLVAGKYRLDAELGRGATGTVWRAVQTGLERTVAIKLMHAQIANRDDARVRFAREARVAASLQHPSSVAVLDFGEDRDGLFLVMELVEGETLRTRMQRGPLGLRASAAVVRQIATALSAAHRIRLVHRDIKPENVILPGDGSAAKVVDFGLAFIVDPLDAPLIGRVTHDGSVVGTPAYMSPEQVRGASVAPPADVYALGCVFYELLAARPPFVGNVGEVLTRHAYATAIALRQLDLPERPPAAIDSLVAAMLAKSSASRPSASRVAAALADYEGPSAVRAGRTSVPVLERGARMVEAAPAEAARTGELSVGVIGALGGELELALLAAELRIRRWDDGERDGDVVWLREATPDRVAALVGEGHVVVAGIPSSDATRLPALIRAGAADAVVEPIDGDDLVRRLWRAQRLRGIA